jgi:hypothetical protein
VEGAEVCVICSEFAKKKQFHENEHDGRHKCDEKLNQDNDNQDEMSYNLRTYMVKNGLIFLDH